MPLKSMIHRTIAICYPGHYGAEAVRYFGTDQVDVRVEQGYEIGRPSLIYLRAKQSGERIEVNVGGKVIPIARAELT
jgi:predicted PhzF superfamily epimerase YddE/YHI9